MPLDGLRAIAVLWVFGLHTLVLQGAPFFLTCFAIGKNSGTFAWMVPLLWGDLGVDIFFVLSGFLIAFVLFREVKKYGEIDFVGFIRARYMRIWPVMFVYVVCLGVDLTMRGADLKTIALAVIPPNLFINNFMGMHQQLWSIAVEFQFYMISPFIVESFIYSKNPMAWPIILSVLSIVLCLQISWTI